MQLFFARHGESWANIFHEISNHGIKHPLTERGWEQAQLLGTRLKGENILGIFSSPLLRAFQTTRVVSDILNIPFQISTALVEYDCGFLEGRSDQEAWATYNKNVNNWASGSWEDRIQGGESLYDIRNRFLPWIHRISENYQDKNGAVLMITHGGLLRTVLPFAMNNITHDFSMNHLIPNTDLIIAEGHLGKINCVSWCGIPV